MVAESSSYYSSYEDKVFIDVETVRHMLKTVAKTPASIKHWEKELEKIEKEHRK